MVYTEALNPSVPQPSIRPVRPRCRLEYGPIPGAREPWIDIRTDKAEQPHDYENNDNCLQLKISPFLNNP